MRQRESDTIDTWLWLWGALCKDLRKIEASAGRILAAEFDPSTMDDTDRKLTAAAGHSDPTLANVEALSRSSWLAIYTIHVEMRRWPRLWSDLVKFRFEARLEWQDIQKRMELNDNQRKVMMGLIKRELGMSMRMAGMNT